MPARLPAAQRRDLFGCKDPMRLRLNGPKEGAQVRHRPPLVMNDTSLFRLHAPCRRIWRAIARNCGLWGILPAS